MSSLNQPDIYQFTDYREFVKQYYLYQKQARMGFSYRAFSEEAGFTSPSFIKLVIDGQKNLTKSSIGKLAHAMELDSKQTEYFEHIVFFNQAKSFEDKKQLLESIDQFHKKNRPKQIEANDYDYLKEWFHCVLREMVSLKDFEEKCEELAKLFPFKITPGQIKKSLSFLEAHGFIERDEKGCLHKKEKTLATGDISQNEVLSMIARTFHLKMVELAGRAVTIFPPEKRNTSNTTLSLSQKSYEIAVERIKALRYELLELAASDEEVDNVYQLNINLFPFLDIKESNGTNEN